MIENEAQHVPTEPKGCFLDYTYCISKNCENKCGRKMSESIKLAIEKMEHARYSISDFCDAEGNLDERERNSKVKKLMNLTSFQEKELCFLIDEWYLFWEDMIVSYEKRFHNLKSAKEYLKTMIRRSHYDEPYRLKEETK